MNKVPTTSEKHVLEKVARSKQIHFILLVILICLASLTFLFPNETSPLVILFLGVCIILVGISSMRLQYFQECPRCATRMVKGQPACANCGLHYYASDESGS